MTVSVDGVLDCDQQVIHRISFISNLMNSEPGDTSARIIQVSCSCGWKHFVNDDSPTTVVVDPVISSLILSHKLEVLLEAVNVRFEGTFDRQALYSAEGKKLSADLDVPEVQPVTGRSVMTEIWAVFTADGNECKFLDCCFATQAEATVHASWLRSQFEPEPTERGFYHMRPGAEYVYGEPQHITVEHIELGKRTI